MSRRLAREIAFKTLFQYDMGKNSMDPAFTELVNEFGLNSTHALFAKGLVEGTISHLEAIDRILEKYLVNWTLPRLAAVDRSVLRLAAYELLYSDGIPHAVAINEALELSKSYNSEEAAKFLNGVLDRLAVDHNKKGAEVE